jgi:hypothetical protein
MKNLLLLAVTTAFMISPSCKKDDPVTLTIVGTWKRTQKQTRKAINTAWQAATLDPCIADNTYKYESGSIMSWDEGATKCDPTDLQSGSAAYTFEGKDGGLTNPFGGFAFRVENLTEKTLIIVEPRLTNGAGDDIQWTLTKQ